jgi:hypothetical protein
MKVLPQVQPGKTFQKTGLVLTVAPVKKTLRWWKFSHNKSKLKFKWVDVSARVK